MMMRLSVIFLYRPFRLIPCFPMSWYEVACGLLCFCSIFRSLNLTLTDSYCTGYVTSTDSREAESAYASLVVQGM